MSRTIRTPGRLGAVKVAGSIAVVGAAAAVAGLGTFGNFTASTEAVDAGVDTGVLSIDVSLTDGSAPPSVPVALPRMSPGDAISMPLDLRNSGNVDLASVTLTSTATTSSLLDQEAEHGLQLTLESCAAPWTRTGPISYSCAGTAVPLYTGPIAAQAQLPAARSLAAGATDHLVATISFPTTGGDVMQNQTSMFAFVFDAVQRGGAAR
ncbi:Camelysin metallo-endopeptidase [Blastococcus aggregatus]|uniref:Camelysin metallo-endopeptidase n=1 Tax=Blastococcus aggregatus TaxID=38502 RepID=A0A285V141_9ACTN|nr:TasA family protein [Blastococcus aggregatus]SOC47770.1 Camelysin metallo-endopeptidase [Blastococcus aggregatus]